MYAKITNHTEGEFSYIKLVATEHIEHIHSDRLCSYIYKGSFDEQEVDSILKLTKPIELYIPDKLIKHFSLGFYQKYSNILNIVY